jgi:hypothetical protein
MVCIIILNVPLSGPLNVPLSGPPFLPLECPLIRFPLSGLTVSLPGPPYPVPTQRPQFYFPSTGNPGEGQGGGWQIATAPTAVLDSERQNPNPHRNCFTGIMPA